MFNKNLKRALAISLAAAMTFAAVACGSGNTKPTPSNTPVPTKPTEENNNNTTTNTPAPVENFTYNTDYATNTTNGGSVTTQLGQVGGGTVGYDVYAGQAGKDYTDAKVYTFNDYMAGMSNLKWAPHTWETNDDSYVLDFISMGFYSFDLNSKANGWSVTCEMAEALPVDVTAEYVGKFGVKEGDKAKAWKLALNKNAKWQDGTAINADTYIYSYKELLDPVMKNRRADSLYSGEFVVVGSKEYFYQGQEAFNPIVGTVAKALADGAKLEELYIDVVSFWGVDATYVDAAGNASPRYVTLTDTTVYGESVNDAFSGKELYDTYFAAGAKYEDKASSYVCSKAVYEANYSWDNVGIVKTGEYELVIIVKDAVADPNYYVPYHLSSTYLVYEPLWESLKRYFDGDGKEVAKGSADIKSITTTYGTSKETTISYGPYVLDEYQLDKLLRFTRNDNWYGYKDDKHKGQYQTDIINCQVIAKQATALLAFLNGEIDKVSLVSADMAKYGSSDYIRYTPQSYTTKISFNTNLDKTTGRGTNSQVMTNVNFRKAFSLALDRTKFASSYTSAGSAGYGLLNNMYVYDPFTGASYRGTDGAKQALVNLYGLTYGEGGDYEDLDDAYDAITGYDLVAAKKLMAKAYDELVADKVYDGTSAVKIDFRVYADDDTYVQMFNFLESSLKAACEGTGFEGKISMSMTVDPDYYDTNYSGNADMIFTTWGGAAYSPWTMLYQCYCDAADGSGQQMEYGFDTSTKFVEIEIDGKKFNASLQKWAAWANANDDAVLTSVDGTYTLKAFGDYDAATKAKIFGILEYAYLSYFATMPMYYRNSASLVAQKGDYAVKEYVDLVGFGGLKFFTYNYDDTEWAAKKGSLQY